MSKKKMYIISGCNGAGKTTASFTVLPDILGCKEFVNADEIAKGISPFDIENAAIEAGRIMILRINELLKGSKDFAFETTLSSKSIRHIIAKAKRNNFEIVLLFFWLQNTQMAIERVKLRVADGGHHIASDIIERRYKAGINNLFKLYLELADSCFIFDNSLGRYDLIAEAQSGNITILSSETFNQLKKHAEANRI